MTTTTHVGNLACGQAPLSTFAGSALLLLLWAMPSAQGQARSDDPRAQLALGPLRSGDVARLDLATSIPNAPAVLLWGLSSTPTPLVGLLAPPLGLKPLEWIPVQTNAAGRLELLLPIAPGSFPPGIDLPLFAQAGLFAQNGQLVLSNRTATRIEPLPTPPGFLVDAAQTALPAAHTYLDAVAVAAADLTANGVPDLVFGGESGLFVWTGVGDGTFVEQPGVPPLIGEPVSALAVGDINGSGLLDVVTGGGFSPSGSVPNRLFLNFGGGVLVATTGLPAGDGEASDLALADLDGDGNLDLVVVNGPEGHLPQPGGVDRLYLGDGAGQFVEHAGFVDPTWNDTLTRSTSVAVGDVDNDGFLDLFITKSDPAGLLGGPGQRNVLLMNDGQGAFLDATDLRMPGAFSDNSLHAAFVDIDRDGDLDIVIANSLLVIPTSNSNDVWINQGGMQGGATGFFVDDPNSFLESQSTDPIRLRVRVADVNADGYPDILLAVHDWLTPVRHKLFLNQGGEPGGVPGTFADATWFNPGQFIAGDAVFVDARGTGLPGVLLLANGVLLGDPLKAAAVRYLENTLR